MVCCIYDCRDGILFGIVWMVWMIILRRGGGFVVCFDI